MGSLLRTPQKGKKWKEKEFQLHIELIVKTVSRKVSKADPVKRNDRFRMLRCVSCFYAYLKGVESKSLLLFVICKNLPTRPSLKLERKKDRRRWLQRENVLQMF